MFNELLFNDEFKTVVLNSTKQTTSRLSSKLSVHDTFIYEDVDFVITSVEKKKVRDVDFISESFLSTQELVDKLNQIYYHNEKLRQQRNLTKMIDENDEMFVITFIRINVVR